MNGATIICSISIIYPDKRINEFFPEPFTAVYIRNSLQTTVVKFVDLILEI